MGYDLFVSYSSRDKHFVDALVHSLEETQYRCWYAPRDIAAGLAWPTAISQAIRSIPAMLLVFSSSSNSSEEISRELTLASANKCLVIPVRIENVAPGVELEYHLSNRHWLDVYDMEMEAAISSVIEGLRQYEPVFSDRADQGEQKAPVGPAASDATADTRPGASSPDGMSPPVSRHVRPRLVAALFLAVALLAGFIAYSALGPSGEVPWDGPRDEVVELAPKASLYRYAGQGIIIRCLRLASDPEKKKPDEFLVAVIGTGGPLDGTILRLKAEYAGAFMGFSTMHDNKRYTLLRVGTTGSGTGYAPGMDQEVRVEYAGHDASPEGKQAFVDAYLRDKPWVEK